MDFIKRQMFLIGCGLGAAAGVALAVTGLRAMPAVMTEMEKAQRVYQSLNTLPSGGANQEILNAHQKRIDLILRDRSEVFAEAAKLYERYKPLREGVFPDGSEDARRAFRAAYNKEMAELMQSLRAGQPATTTDIELMAERIREEEARRLLMEGKASPPPRPEDKYTPAGVLTKIGAKTDAVARAHIAAAQRIYCYAIDYAAVTDLQDVAALYFEPGLKDTGTADAPLPSSCWWGQVTYWIQKDIVDAIVSLNEEAASQARKNDIDRWVGIMPVKELISIRFSSGYVQPGEDVYMGAAPGTWKADYPPAARATAFTNHASTEFYEVVQFTLKMVVDQRDVPRFVQRLCKDSFYTVLRMAYKDIDPNRGMVGKIYGSEPVVNLIMDAEMIMLGNVFRPWMPDSVCEDYGIACPPREAAAEEG